MGAKFLLILYTLFEKSTTHIAIMKLQQTIFLHTSCIFFFFFFLLPACAPQKIHAYSLAHPVWNFSAEFLMGIPKPSACVKKICAFFCNRQNVLQNFFRWQQNSLRISCQKGRCQAKTVSFWRLEMYRLSSIDPVNVETQIKKPRKQQPCKSRLLGSTKGKENKIEL